MHNSSTVDLYPFPPKARLPVFWMIEGPPLVWWTVFGKFSIARCKRKVESQALGYVLPVLVSDIPANKVRGGKRPLPCEVGTDVFFLDPYGNVMPCNGSDEPMIMGNLNEQAFDEIWNSQRADDVREQVKNCSKECWMIGSASPAMKKRVWVPAKWVVKNKLRMMQGKRGETCLEPVGK